MKAYLITRDNKKKPNMMPKKTNRDNKHGIKHGSIKKKKKPGLMKPTEEARKKMEENMKIFLQKK